MAVQKTRHQRRHILQPRGQARHMDWKYPQPVVEILPEMPRGHRCCEIPIGRCDHTHVHRPHGSRSNRHDLAVFEHTQEFHLHFRRRVSDFVEEDRATIGQFEEPLPIGCGAGKCASHVAEEFAFDHAGGQRCQTRGHERLVAAVAVGMDGPRGKFLASACVACDERGQIAWSHQSNLLKHPLHRQRTPHQRKAWRDVCTRRTHRRHGFACAIRQCPRDNIRHAIQVERFDQILKRTGLHGPNGRVEIPEGRHHHNGCVRGQCAKLRHCREAVAAR